MTTSKHSPVHPLLSLWHILDVMTSRVDCIDTDDYCEITDLYAELINEHGSCPACLASMSTHLIEADNAALPESVKQCSATVGRLACHFAAIVANDPPADSAMFYEDIAGLLEDTIQPALDLHEARRKHGEVIYCDFAPTLPTPTPPMRVPGHAPSPWLHRHMGAAAIALMGGGIVGVSLNSTPSHTSIRAHVAAADSIPAADLGRALVGSAAETTRSSLLAMNRCNSDDCRYWTTTGLLEVLSSASWRRSLEHDDHDGPVWALERSPSHLLASAGADGFLCLWADDAASLSPKSVFETGAENVSGLAFSPDGTMVAVNLNDRSVGILDLESEQYVNTLTGHSGPINDVDFSPQSDLLVTASTDHSAKIWTLHSSVPRYSFLEHAGAVTTARFVSTTTVLTTDELNATKIWDTTTGRVHFRWPGRAIGLSNDRSMVVLANDDGASEVRSTRDGNRLFGIHRHATSLANAVFAPDDSLIGIVDMHGRVEMWDPSGHLVAELPGHEGGVESLVFSPDGKFIATTGLDGMTRVWLAASGHPTMQYDHLRAHPTKVEFIANGDFIAMVDGDGFFEFGRSHPVEPVELHGYTEQVFAVAGTPDGPVTGSISSNGDVHIWRGFAHAPSSTLTVAKTSWAATPAQQSEFWKDTFETDIYDTDRLAAATERQRPLDFALSPDGRRVAFITGEASVSILDTVTGANITKFDCPSQRIERMVFSPDGRKLAVTDDVNFVRLWDADSSAPLAVLRGHSATVTQVAFGRDSELIGTVSDDKTVRVWDASSGYEISRFEQHGLRITDVAFSLDGAQLTVVSDDGSARILAGVPLEEITLLPVANSNDHPTRLVAVTYSPDGRRIAAAGANGLVRIWDASTARELMTMRQSQGLVTGLAFSADGNHIFTVIDGRTVTGMDATASQLEKTACISLRGLPEYQDDDVVRICDRTSVYAIATNWIAEAMVHAGPRA